MASLVFNRTMPSAFFGEVLNSGTTLVAPAVKSAAVRYRRCRPTGQHLFAAMAHTQSENASPFHGPEATVLQDPKEVPGGVVSEIPGSS